jgi:hypothetical protein
MGRVLDIMLKDQPTLQVWPERYGANVYMFLAVKNTAKHSILVLSASATTELFEIWKDTSALSAANAAVGMPPEFILQAEETRYLPIESMDRRAENDETPSWLILRWRSLRHPSWWQCRVKLKISHTEFDRIKKAA